MRKKILVLGGSFGGLTAAFEVKRRLDEQAEVTVISKEDRFVFLPSLPWVVTGHQQATARPAASIRCGGRRRGHGDAGADADADRRAQNRVHDRANGQDSGL